MTLVTAEDTLAWTPLPALPETPGVAGAFAGVSGGALLVAGGANFPAQMPWEGGAKVWHDQVWLLESTEAPWRCVGRLPRPLGYGVCASGSKGVLCVGGSDAQQHYAEAFRLVWKSESLAIEPLPFLPVALAGASGALVNDVLVIVGGSTQPGEQSASNRAFALDLASTPLRWRELPPLPAPPRLYATAAAWGDTFYVFGGATLAPNANGQIARSYLLDAWSYRPADGWQRLADLPKPSVAAPSPAPVVEGCILLIAGDDGSRAGCTAPEQHPGFAPGILAYDPTLDRWSESGQTPAPRATAPSVLWGERFVIPSGELRPGLRSPEVWSFPARR